MRHFKSKNKCTVSWDGKHKKEPKPLGEVFETNNVYFTNDNFLFMSDLLTTHRSSIDLIYIDPPFFTGVDFKAAGGEVAFRDKWASYDNFLQFLYERILLMRELLSNTGSIYVHCDYRFNHTLRMIMDEVFGVENFRNEILTRRAQTKNLQGQFSKINTMNVFNDSILWYSKNQNTRFNAPIKPASESQKKESWQSMWNNADRPTMRYELINYHITKGQWKWKKERAYDAVKNYNHYLEKYADEMTLVEYWLKTEKKHEFIRRSGNSKPQYWIPPRDSVIADNNWFDIKGYDYFFKYPTQKSEALLERIIQASSNPGDIVADFFMGSGTTIAVAKKLGRNYIGCDSSEISYGITKKRIEGQL